ncbi:TadE/TadG family type IV pilus assembly protein [Brevibacillus fulvus]|uniref:Flp pilus assembly protein TadG n=1 Tax=Brevibacillus fulvus TaxID=1125967 RepID=A0A938XXG6_9BACL|nr:TadE family protein [Brevibacillus fulvus]MBM7592298.1 Flp pilus assembly protein TadG [Brevibacillus fulvus]
MNRLTKLLKDQRGSQLVEFILTFPLVWMLIVFTFDQFTILYNKQKALSAAYEAGRIASVQPNYGLAQYYASSRGEEELSQAIGITDSDIRIKPVGSWQKGNHFKAVASIRFRLLATGQPYELMESYQMMIENAGGLP